MITFCMLLLLIVSAFKFHVLVSCSVYTLYDFFHFSSQPLFAFSFLPKSVKKSVEKVRSSCLLHLGFHYNVYFLVYW